MTQKAKWKNILEKHRNIKILHRYDDPFLSLRKNVENQILQSEKQNFKINISTNYNYKKTSTHNIN